MRRILAIKLADIGDALLVTPALRALRQAHPEARLDVLVTPQSAAALEDLPFIDRLLLLDKHPFDRPLGALRSGRWRELFALAWRLRREQYDTVILFHHLSLRFGVLKHALLTLATGARRRIGLDNGRGWFLTERVTDDGFGARHEVAYWLALAAAAGAEAGGTDQPRPVLAVTENDRAYAERALPAADRPTVALHPGSGGYSLARRWDADKMVELGRRLAEKVRLVIVGTPTDGTAELAAELGTKALDLGGRTTLGQLAAVLARCDVLVGADSGVLHVASTVATPTVALFGPTNHRAWAPLLPRDQLRVVRAGSACSPCAYTLAGLGAPDGCPQRTCMAMITVAQVQREVESLLTGTVSSEGDGGLSQRPAGPPTVDILGVPVHATTFAGLLERIETLVEEDRAHQIATVNPEFVMAARRDPIFRVVLERATLCLPDGVGLLWAARRLGRQLPERVTGSDGVPLIAERAAEKGWRVFFLGAAPGVAERTAEILSARYPGLQVAGTYAGSPRAEEEEAIVSLVNESQADILLVAYGAPRQDKWIARNLPRLRVCVAMGVGGSFDFISGKAVRAPVWMQRLGIEWLHRLLREPWRWRRMMALPRFVLAVLFSGVRAGRRQRGGR